MNGEIRQGLESPCKSTFQERTHHQFIMDTPKTFSSAEDLAGVYKSLYFFSNKLQVDHATLFRSLHRHSKDKRYRYLANFLNDSRDAIKAEVRRLPTSQRCLIQPFNSILTLAADPASHDGPLKASLEAALLISAQLASLIG